MSEREQRYLAAYRATWFVNGDITGSDEFLGGRIQHAVALAAYRANWSAYLAMQHNEVLMRCMYSVGLLSSSERLVCMLTIGDVLLRVAATSNFFLVKDGWGDGMPSTLRPVPVTLLCREIEDNLYTALSAVQAYARVR